MILMDVPANPAVERTVQRQLDLPEKLIVARHLVTGTSGRATLARPDAGAVEGLCRGWADCLYAPGIRTRAEIRAVVAAVAPKSVNLLIGPAGALTLEDVAALGVRRISLGSALARSAWGGFLQAAHAIADHGRFDGFADAPSNAQLNALFRDGANGMQHGS